MDEEIKKIFIGIVPNENNFHPFRIYLVNPTNESFFVMGSRVVIANKIKGEKKEKKSFELQPNNYYLLSILNYIGRSDYTIWYYVILKTKQDDVYGFSANLPGTMVEKKNRRTKKLSILDKKGFIIDVVIEKIKDKGKLLIPPIYYCKNKDIEKFYKNQAYANPMGCIKILKEIGGVSEEDFKNWLRRPVKDSATGETLSFNEEVVENFDKVDERVKEEIGKIMNEVMWSEKMTTGKQLNGEQLKELRECHIKALDEQEDIRLGRKEYPNESMEFMRNRIMEIISEKYKNKPSKIISHRSEEQRKRDLEKTNEYSKEHPEALLWYLSQTGQLTDLTKEDIKKINEYVREELKNNPDAELWEIEE